MAIRQARLFVPSHPPYDGTNWAETALAAVVRPLVSDAIGLDWFWFSRYACKFPGDVGDCEISLLPHGFLVNDIHRSIRFRYSMPDGFIGAFEERATQFITNNSCWSSGWLDYGALGELGGSRFCGDVQRPMPSPERMNLVVGVLSSLSRLVLDCLVPADDQGRFRVEANKHEENPHGSSFESLHHLICNITAVPTKVIHYSNGEKNILLTHWQQPPDGYRPAGEFDVKY